MLHCFKCGQTFVAVHKMVLHIKRFHSVNVGCGIPCGQNDCPRQFFSFRNLRRHLSTAHANLVLVDDNDETGHGLLNADNDVSLANDASAMANNDSLKTEHETATENRLELELKGVMQAAFLSFITKLQARANVLLTDTKFVADNLLELLQDVSALSIERVKTLLTELNIDQKLDCVQMLFKDLENVPACLDDVNTEHKQIAYLKDKGFYITPETHCIDWRLEKRHSASLGFRELKNIPDTFQYIPLEQILARIVVECQVIGLSLNPATYSSNDGNIGDWYETCTYANHPFFSKCPDALILHMYVDAFETTNPLGSRTQIHKMEGLYMNIRNLPPCFASKENAIFLVAMWYADDIKTKQNAYDKIFEPVVKSLKMLETDEGVVVKVNDQNVTVRAALALFSADNLGYHSLFGFLESFSAKKFCRLCEATKEESQKHFFETDFQMRTIESYNDAVTKSQLPGYIPAETGIRTGCSLNNLQYFHVMENHAVDAMHDLLEGVVPNELKDILSSLSSKGYFSLQEFNSLLQVFNYGNSDLNSRPQTFVSFTGFRMTASECWCLTRNLPCIVGHKVPRDDPHWKLLIFLLDILDIVFAPKVNDALATQLAYLVAEHHEFLLQVYPDKRLTPKYHFLLHYASALVKCGPPCRYWCMRFEARHNFFNKVARITNCFKNIAKTLAKRSQLALANAFLTHTIFQSKPVVGPGTEELIGSMEEGNVFSKHLGLCQSETLFVAKWVQVGHYTIEQKCIVVLRVSEGVPEFGYVEKVVCIKDQTFLLLKKMMVKCFDDHFHAYSVDFLADTVWLVIDVTQLKDHIPLTIHCVMYEERLHKFVSQRYVLI